MLYYFVSFASGNRQSCWCGPGVPGCAATPTSGQCARAALNSGAPSWEPACHSASFLDPDQIQARNRNTAAYYRVIPGMYKAFGELSGQIGMPLALVSNWARAFQTTVTSVLAILFNILEQLKCMWLNRNEKRLLRQNVWSIDSFTRVFHLISTEIKWDPK